MSQVTLNRVWTATKKILRDIVKLKKAELTSEKVDEYSTDLKELIKILESMDDRSGKVEMRIALLLDYISLLGFLRDYLNDPTAEKAKSLLARGDTDPTIRPVIEHFVQ
ncbi:hypothetical protein PIROE2DRAFT_57683 [Piromyces sp. E2]|nr:hypothetical protein PIROE2DRAFT_57683 [Piromyces sp. E2]|eukprot:OUM69051.1 hypothetical protein PIROE2DRAFT_57683 [Piromyces sp. E2]